MKKFFFLCLLASVFCLQAQTSKTDGPAEKAPGAPDVIATIGSNNTSFFVLRKNEEKLTVEAYNKKTLSREWSTEVPVKDGLAISYDRGYFCGINGNQIYLLVPVGIKTTLNLVLRTLDMSGKLNPEEKTLLAINEFRRGMFSSWETNRMSPLMYTFSPDSSKAIFWLFPARDILASETGLRGATLDLKNMKIILDKLPQTYQNVFTAAKSIAISNEGQVAYAFIYSPTGNQFGPYSFLIGFIDNNGVGKTMSPNFQAADKFILRDCALEFGKNKKLFFAAIVTDDIKKDGNKKNSAVYAMRYDLATSKMDFESTQYLSEDWRVKYDPAKDGPSGYTQSNHYRFAFNFADDGNWIISALKTSGFHVSMKYHESDDAVIAKVNTKGNIEWIKTLPIAVGQRGGYNKEGLIGYWQSAMYQNKMYYVYDNDIADEKDIDLNKADAGKQSGAVVDYISKNVNTSCVTLDMSGKLQRTIICNNKEKGFSPTYGAFLIEKDKMLLHFIGKGQQNFSVISLQ